MKPFFAWLRDGRLSGPSRPFAKSICLCSLAACLASAILIVCIFSDLALASPQTPAECLNSIQQAVDRGDAETFTSLVDVDSILQKALDDFIMIARSPIASGMPPLLALFFSGLASNNAQSMRQLVLDETRAFILNGIASGAFAGKNLDSRTRDGFLAPLFAGASIGRKSISSIGDTVKDGDGWLLPFTVHDSDNGNDYAIIGKFAMVDGKCRLQAIENLDQLIRAIQRESQE